MREEELSDARRQRDNLRNRLQLMREGKLRPLVGGTDEARSIKRAEEWLAAVERKIARLEDDD